MKLNNLIINIGKIDFSYSCLFFFFLEKDRARIKLIIWRIKNCSYQHLFFSFLFWIFFKWNNNLTTNIGIIENFLYSCFIFFSLFRRMIVYIIQRNQKFREINKIINYLICNYYVKILTLINLKYYKIITLSILVQDVTM